MVEVKISEADTEHAIFGASPLVWGWWIAAPYNWQPDPVTLDAPDGWVTTLVGLSQDDETATVTVEITHKVIMDAMELIRAGAVRVSDECLRECRMALINWDAVDFDACTADEVLQVAVYGRIVFG